MRTIQLKTISNYLDLLSPVSIDPAFQAEAQQHAPRSYSSTRSDDFCEKKMLIGYARVSTQDQNTDLQLDALQAAGCDKIFVEKASGAQRERPELLAALAYLRPEDTLVVWKLDRLARSLETTHRDDREDGGTTDRLPFAHRSDRHDHFRRRLIFHIFASLAEFERSIIRDRTRSGLESARARGRLGGRPPALPRTTCRPPKRSSAIQ